MTPLTDDDLGDLLRATFAGHERLADPERAVSIATTPARPRHTGRALLAAAAAVAVVAGGTTYALSRNGSPAHEADLPGPSPTTATDDGHQPPLPVLQSNAANRAAAVDAADRVAAEVPAYPGATTVSSVAELGDTTLSSVHPGGHTILRSRFWTVTGAGPHAVAQWYATHAPAGLVGDGGVGGSGDGTTWIDEVYWDPATPSTSQQGTSVELGVTRTSAGAVGIRATVSSVWLPARPTASFVQDVSSIRVDIVKREFDVKPTHLRTVATFRNPGVLLRAARAFNALPGMTPIVLSCPAMRESWTYRFEFETASGNVVAVDDTSACGFGMTVKRDGHVVQPMLGDPTSLLQALGIKNAS